MQILRREIVVNNVNTLPELEKMIKNYGFGLHQREKYIIMRNQHNASLNP